MCFNCFWCASLLLAAGGLAAGSADIPRAPPIPRNIAAAVADEHRPADQTQADRRRKPAQMMAFAGVKAGDRVADFMPGNAYFTRMLSKAVGPSGKVYAFIPSEEIKNCPPTEVAGTRAIARDPVYRNVALVTGPVNQFSMPERLDLLWTALNYHDLHDAFMGPADVQGLNRSFFDSLKPGGVFMVIDHAASSGSGLRDTESLHRIDPLTLRKEIEAAGFVFEAQNDDLHNVADDHSKIVFDPLVRGRTDQFVFKFRKPNP